MNETVHSTSTLFRLIFWQKFRESNVLLKKLLSAVVDFRENLQKLFTKHCFLSIFWQKSRESNVLLKKLLSTVDDFTKTSKNYPQIVVIDITQHNQPLTWFHQID